MLPEGAPSRWLDRETLWNEEAASDPLRRADFDAGGGEEGAPRTRHRQLAREIEIALPRELSQAEAISLVQDFVREQFVARGMVADLNVHWSTAADGDAQPHAHVLLTLRRVDPTGSRRPERMNDRRASRRRDPERGARCARDVTQELLKRVTELADFSRCYENDVMKAKGLVAEIRRVVEVKDSFTRMRQECDREAEARRAEQQREIVKAREHRKGIAAAKTALFALFAETNPQRRGKALEGVLNDLFRAYGALVAEDVRRKGTDGGIEEQLDGVIELDTQMYLVEMTWRDRPLGPAEISPHISRLMLRHGVRGVFISSSDYTPGAVNMCKDFLQQKVLVLCTLREVVDVLNRRPTYSTCYEPKSARRSLSETPSRTLPSIGPKATATRPAWIAGVRRSVAALLVARPKFAHPTRVPTFSCSCRPIA